MNNRFENKKILFIGIGFYDYEIEIKKELENHGANVKYFSSVNRTIYTRLLHKIKFFSLEKKNLRRYIKKNIQKQIDLEFDFVFIIKGENIVLEDMYELHSMFKDAKFILYLWDSIERNSDVLKIIDCFDSVYTFDNVDSVRYNLKLRPLFYRDDYKVNKIDKRIYDIMFIGWAHSDRIKYLLKLRDYLICNNKIFYFRILTGRLMYISLLFKKKITKNDRDLFIFKNINYNKYREIIGKSKSVLDIHHPNQNGLTMRTIEAINSGCFLYTTNENIKNYNEISPEFYKCVKRNEIFRFRKNYPTNINLPQKFSLESFTNELFFELKANEEN